MRVVGADAAGVAAVAEAVRAGGVVLYPTETVYGLGGDAARPDVRARTAALKGRDGAKPMLMLTDEWARVMGWLGPLERAHRRLMDHAPPLAVTLLLPASRAVPASLVGPGGLVGIRRTTDPFCRALVAAADAPLLSTSANPAGAPPPARFESVHPDLLAAVDLAVDAGHPLAGVPSAVARVERGAVVVVREGAVDVATLERIAAG